MTPLDIFLLLEVAVRNSFSQKLK